MLDVCSIRFTVPSVLQMSSRQIGKSRRAGNVNRVDIRPKETAVILQRSLNQMPYAVIQAQVPSSERKPPWASRCRLRSG